MAQRKKYMCSVFVFDVNSEEAFKKEALKCYLSICGERYFSERADCSQLILINTAETSNKKNDKNETRYLHIVEATEMVRYDPENRKYIEEAVSARGNWIEGLQVAVEELLTSSDTAMFDTFQLIVLSDLSTPINMNKAHINKVVKSIIKQLRQINGYIYFLGPDIPVPNMLCSKKDVYNWMQNIKVDENNSNLKIASEIVTECLGVMCDLNIGLELVQSYKYSRKGFPFTEPLKFRDLEIYTTCVKYIDSKSFPTPKRDKDGITETVYVYAEDQSTEVNRDNVIKAMALHNKLIMIPNDVNRGIREYNRFFKLLGFTDASNVREDYMFPSSIIIITVYDLKDPEIGAINYIITACHKLQKYGIALRAFMKNSRPKLYCLIPKLDPPCFIGVELPYAEDFNIVYETKDCTTVKFKENAYSDYNNVAVLKDDIYSYLDGISMNDKVKVHPSLRINSGKRKIIDNLVRKVNGEEIIQTPLPLGDLRVAPLNDLYSAINANWFPKNETESNDAT